METFGHDAQQLQLRSQETGVVIDLDLASTTRNPNSNSSSSSPVSTTNSASTSVQNSSSPLASTTNSASTSVQNSFTANTPTLQSLNLLERYGVSDEFYHELFMLFPELPRSYHVKRVRHDMSSLIEIETLLCQYHGASRPFKSTLAAALAIEVWYNDIRLRLNSLSLTIILS